MTVFEKLAELGLDYYVEDDLQQITIYEEDNGKVALDTMREWVKEHKAPRHDGDDYVDGYFIVFNDENKYPDYL